MSTFAVIILVGIFFGFLALNDEAITTLPIVGGFAAIALGVYFIGKWFPK